MDGWMVGWLVGWVSAVIIENNISVIILLKVSIRNYFEILAVGE